MRHLTITTCLLALLLPALPCLAQELEEPGGLVADEDRARIEQADHLRYDPAEAMYYLDGNVVFSHQDIKLYCDEAVYDYDNNSAVAKGNPKVVEPETTITGDIIEADFDAEVATIVGNVKAVTQKQPDEDETAPAEEEDDDEEPPRDLEELHEKKTTITCEKVVHEYGEDAEITTATGRVKAVQEDKTVYADRAVHEEKKDLITLTGDVRVLTDKGDELRCPKAVISTEEEWIRAEDVQVVGTRREDEDEEPEAEAPPAEDRPAEAEPPQEPPAEQEPPPAQENQEQEG
jgi:lipopolysaccharide assembly outer membrane protein LptD (OstA)